MEEITATETIENKIFTIRGIKVMIDRYLAELYGVQTFRLNEVVKRNIKRFPENFMFRLNEIEFKELIANCDRFKILKHSSNFPFAFMEQGVAMLSSVLNSEKAIQVNIQIMNTFVRMRQWVITQLGRNKDIEELAQMLMLHIENTTNKFNEHDIAINKIVKVLNNLIENPLKTKPIGFNVK